MQPIVYVDTSTIREAKLRELKHAMQHLAAFVKSHMPRLISYAFYLDEDERQMTVVAVHPDSESLAFHMAEGADEFRKFAPLIELVRIDVYGRVSDEVRERLNEKARALGQATVTLHDHQAGFAR